MKKCLLLFCIIGIVCIGCNIASDNPEEGPTAPSSYEVRFDPYTPQDISGTETDFQGVITGDGFLSCTVCFYINTTSSNSIWVLTHPSVGKINIHNNSTAVFVINVPKWLEFQDGPDTEVIVAANVMETGFTTDIVLANVVP